MDRGRGESIGRAKWLWNEAKVGENKSDLGVTQLSGPIGCTSFSV